MNRKGFVSERLVRIFLFLALATFSVSWFDKPVQLKNGIWRATIRRADDHKIVFNFLSKDSAGKKVIYILNGNEHLLADSVTTTGDSVFIQLPFFESGFRARITEEGRTGR